MNLYKIIDNPRIYNTKTMLLSFGRRSVREYLSSMPKITRASKILDVGCGTGGHAAAFSQSITGIDINTRYLRYAASHHQGTYAVMDAARLALGDNTFDFVFSAGLFHHLPDDHIPRVISEMRRVTRPGGTVLLVEDVLPTKKNMGYLLLMMDRGKCPRTLAHLMTLLSPFGLKTEKENIMGSFPYERAALIWEKSKVI